MSKPIYVKPFINKANGQCSIHLPKKKMPKDMQDNILNLKSLKLKFEGWT